MKYFVFFLKGISESKRNSFLMFVFVLFSTFMINTLLPMNTEYVNQTQSVKSIDELVLLSLNNPNYTPNDMFDVMENLTDWHKVGYNAAGIDDSVFAVFVYNSYIDRHMNYNFAKGGRIQNDDQIIITYSASQFFDVGDIVEVYFFTAEGEMQSLEKEVVGILSHDTVFFPVSNGSDISARMLTVNLNDTNRMLDAGDDGLGFITFDTDLWSPFEGDVGVYFLESYDIQDIYSFESVGKKFGVFSYGTDIYNEALQNELENRRDNRTILVAIILLCIATLFGCNIISTYRRRNEFGILFLCGSTWIKALFFEMLKNLIILSIAFICALFFSKAMLENVIHLPASKNAFVFSILFIGIVYAVTTIAVMLIIKKESIDNLLRGD